MQWLRDGLGVIKKASETGELAAKADPAQDVYLVPAFVGLGAPHWDPDARAAVYGMTRNTGPAEFARAALEAVCYQTRDLLEAMHKDWKRPKATRCCAWMRHGGFRLDHAAPRRHSRRAVDRPTILETTAMGAAWLAGSRAGVWPDRKGFAEAWAKDRRFEPTMDEKMRAAKVRGWKDAVRRTLG